MTYAVEISRAASKAVMDLDVSTQRRIVTAINNLGEDPRPAGAVKLTGADGYRIRVGDYRIVYMIDDSVRIVTVTRVAHRREVYRRTR